MMFPNKLGKIFNTLSHTFCIGYARTNVIINPPGCITMLVFKRDLFKLDVERLCILGISKNAKHNSNYHKQRNSRFLFHFSRVWVILWFFQVNYIETVLSLFSLKVNHSFLQLRLSIPHPGSFLKYIHMNQIFVHGIRSSFLTFPER